MRCRMFLFIGLVLLSLGATAQPVITLTEVGKVDVNGHLSYLKDATQQLKITEVQKLTFQSLPSDESPNMGFDRSAHWFKADVTNTASNTEWLIEVAYAPLDRIDLYVVKNDSILHHKTSGDHYPVSQHDVAHRQPIFKFNISQGDQQTIYFRVQSISSIQIPVTIWQRDAFAKASYQVQIVNGLFYGAMFLMILYQLFLFLSVRDQITFYYVLTLITMVNVVAFFQGYSFLYLYPEHPEFNDILAMVTGPVFVVCSTLLTRSFLNVKKFSKWLDKLLLADMFLDLALVVLMTVFFRQISFQYHNYLILIHCILALISAGYCFYKKYQPARYYLLAWFTPMIAAVVFTISSIGIMPGYMGTNYSGLMAGCILQMLLLAFALGDRWNQLRKENQLAKEMELKRGQMENERLEQEVQLRLEEIQLKSKRLEEVNQVKDKLFSVVSHDIKGPLSSLQLALSLMKSGDVSREEFQKLSAALEARFSQTTEFIENLLQWATLQLKGESFEPVYVDLNKIAQETIDLLESETRKKEIRVSNNTEPSLQAFADLNMIRSVFRNLFTNALKFTGVNGAITISALRSNGRVVISVADTGVGIPTANRDRMFTLGSITTPGTKQEKGTGLGLLLCKEFIEKNGGNIWFETEEGRGTVFYFSLPSTQSDQVHIPASA
ncbi:MAG TPA: sensor histidine kinase [Ohtaekwangia sp.]